jgi:Domain of unknown function (DUF4158)
MTDNAQTDTTTRRRRPKDICLPEDPSENELAVDWGLSTTDHLEVARCRGDLSRLRFAVQLCVLRKHCRFLENYNSVPVRIINYLCKQLDLPPLLKLEEAERDATEYVQQQRIRDHLNFHTYDERIESELISWLADRAIEGSLPDSSTEKPNNFSNPGMLSFLHSQPLNDLWTVFQLVQKMTSLSSSLHDCQIIFHNRSMDCWKRLALTARRCSFI